MVPSGLLTMNGNLLCAIDVETTGLLCGYHEIIQVAVVPLDNEFEISKVYRPFTSFIIPEYEERWDKEAQQVHGIDKEWLLENGVEKFKAADYLDEWFQALTLPHTKKIIPLAHNFAFEKGFLQHWLGLESYGQFFHYHARDTMILASTLNDVAAYHGRHCPFNHLNLRAMCKKYRVDLKNAHDALEDTIATAKIYKHMITGFGNR